MKGPDVSFYAHHDAHLHLRHFKDFLLGVADLPEEFATAPQCLCDRV